MLIHKMTTFPSWEALKTNSGNFYLKKTNVRDFLKKLSGGNIIEMLVDVLTKEELQLLGQKYVTALKKIGNIYSTDNCLKPLVRRRLLKQLRTSGISYSLANDLNFKCSKFTSKVYENLSGT